VSLSTAACHVLPSAIATKNARFALFAIFGNERLGVAQAGQERSPARAYTHTHTHTQSHTHIRIREESAYVHGSSQQHLELHAHQHMPADAGTPEASAASPWSEPWSGINTTLYSNKPQLHHKGASQEQTHSFQHRDHWNAKRGNRSSIPRERAASSTLQTTQQSTSLSCILRKRA